MRGTGKTTRLLKATPNGGLFVVQNTAMMKYIGDWIEATGRGDDAIVVIAADNLAARRGFAPLPMTIDHCVLDSMALYSQEEQEEFAIQTSMAPYVVYCDEEGDIVTAWMKNDQNR